jgi:hypothetical protein
MIEDILSTITPYLVKGKRLYDEEDIKKILIKLAEINSYSYPYDDIKNSKFDMSMGETVTQYPEATC